jgi:hypothetical protein
LIFSFNLSLFREGQKWEELMGVEKMLLASLAEGESVLRQLAELLQEGEGASFTLNQILCLGILAYSLLGNEFTEEDTAAEGAFKEAVQRVLSRADGSTEVTVAAREKTEHIFEKLRFVREARTGLATYGPRCLVSKEAESPYTPLVRTVIQDLFGEAGRDNADIVQAHPPEVPQQKGFLSTFSQYLVKGKARPDGRAPLVVFVVGGVTCNEIKEIQEVASRNKNEKVLVGGTDITTSKEVYNSVFL